MATKRTKAKVGDIFEIGIDDARVGHGHVLDGKDVLYMAVFEPAHPKGSPPPPEEIARQPILLLADSLDGKIWHGHWPIVGHVVPDLSSIPMPCFKVEIGGSGDFYIESHNKERVRKATAEEVQLLNYRTTVAPIRLENALKAHHGIGEWKEEYDLLTIDHIRKVAKFCNEHQSENGRTGR